MKIVFVSNYINGHQTPFCEYMYQTDGVEFSFLQTQRMDEERVKLGWSLDSSKIPYLFDYETSSKSEIRQLLENADVIILGDAQIDILSYSLKETVLILFYRERLFKKKRTHAVLRKMRLWYKYVVRFRKHKTAVLCASAYAGADFNAIKAFRGNRYKWGYFPRFITYDIDELLDKKQKNVPTQLLWVGRLIDWKRCIDVLKLAKRLKEDNIRFQLTIVGTGTLENELREYVHCSGLSDCVVLIGSCPQAKVRMFMEKANIFVITSTHEEGWGAVVNEAMNSGCAVIGSHAAGSVPFLIQHENNGLIYSCMDVEDLHACVRRCLDDPAFARQMGRNAYQTIQEVWNAENAAGKLLRLIKHLTEKQEEDIDPTGPCSVAPILGDYWFKDDDNERKY